MEHPVKIKSIEKITPDVLKIVTEKPAGYLFTPGQATEVSMNKSGWTDKKRPFTFTSVPDDAYLEFTIKTYASHAGVTNELLQLKTNDELILHDVFGAIAYKGEGVFIAGGAGITPFISIFRQLNSKNLIGNNKLIFANKRKEDIILEAEFKHLLGRNFINILSEEQTNCYAHGMITANFIKTNCEPANSQFYICGPPLMMDSIEVQLGKLHVSEGAIIKELF
jgi:ferredoxin-NADP reductase